MSLSNEEMISNIRQKLNIVNQALLNPEKFKSTPHQDISEIYEFVCLKIHSRLVRLRLLLTI